MAEFEGFEIEGRLGVGATGTVWLARQTALHRRVALKELAPDLGADGATRARLRQEARVLARLEHPNCVGVYAYLETPEAAAIVMEYVEGVSLRALVEHGPLSTEQSLGVLEGALLGLAAAHAQGIVHGDVKPENILVSAEEGQSKLVDFGLAAAVGSTQAPGLGSPAYTSPEAAEGAPLGIHADLYAAGLVLYELLTGGLPPGGGAAVASRVGKAPSDDPAMALVVRAVSNDPAARPQSALAFLEELRAAAEAACGADWRRRALLLPLAGAAGAGAAAAVGAKAAAAMATAGSVSPAGAPPAPTPAAPGTRRAVARHAGRARHLAGTHPWATAVVAAITAGGIAAGAIAAGVGRTPPSPAGAAAAGSPTSSVSTTPSTTSAATAASNRLEGIYRLTLPGTERVCGEVSVDGQILTVSGASAKLTYGGGNSLTGTAKLSASRFVVHVSNGVPRGPGWAGVDLSGTITSDGDLSGQSVNSGIFPGGTNGWGCTSPFSALRTSLGALAASAAPCTTGAITAGVMAVDPSAFDGLDGYACAGKFAYAVVTLGTGSDENDVTMLLVAAVGSWRPSSKAACTTGSLPPAIYRVVCLAN